MIRVLFLLFVVSLGASAQSAEMPSDVLSSDFHKERRNQLRKNITNTVAVFFANAVKTGRTMLIMYHQDPDFFYLTGYKEPNFAADFFRQSAKAPDSKTTMK